MSTASHGVAHTLRMETIIPNFRDLGGLPTVSGEAVPHGRLIRTSSLLRARFVQSGVLVGRVPGAIYVDLRTDAEIERHGPLDLPADWTYRHRSLYTRDLESPGGSDRFEELLERYRPIVLELAVELASANVVVACSLGKDRTGFVVAALLQLLDVAREAILADYTLSNEHLAYFRFDRPYTLVDADSCAAWLDFLSVHLDAPRTTVAGLRTILHPLTPVGLSDATR